MTQVAGLLVDVKSRGASTLDEIRQGLKDIGDEVTSASSKLKGWKKLWDDPIGAKGGWSGGARMLTSMGKAASDIIGTQIRSAATAITDPAKTTYAGAIAVANNYRDVTQRIAVSTGQSFDATGKQILDTSNRLGLLPGRVQAYSSSVRSITGDWQGAMDGLAGYENRALRTDRTLEEMIPTAATLAQTFGIKSTEDVNKFFGTLDRQAKQAGITIDVAERAFLGFSGALASMTSAKPGQLTALTTAFLGASPTPEMGMSALGATSGFLQNHLRYIEARMRGQGKIGKGEHIYDKSGRLRGDKLFDTIEFVQKDLAKFYGTKDPLELAGRISQTGMLSLQDASALVNLPNLRSRAEAATGKKGDEAIEAWQQTPAGKRALADAQKQMKDIGMGETLLPAQDRAVAMGGGAAGIALAASGQVFEKATGIFWDAVSIFSASAGANVVGGAAGAGGAAAALGGLAVALIGGLVGGELGSAAGSYVDNLREGYGAIKERPQAEGFGAGFGAIAAHVGRSRKNWVEMEDAQPADWVTAGPGDAAAKGSGGGKGMVLPDFGGLADVFAAAFVKHLEGKTLRTQQIQPAAAPAGQGQPQ